MVPGELQEKIFEIEQGDREIKYQTAKDVAVSLALRKAEQRRPKEAEIEAIEKRRQETEGEQWANELAAVEWWVQDEHAYDVDAVGMGKGDPNTRCLRCGGLGHMARECASPWDMVGKGGKGGGKMGGKMGGQGKGWNYGGGKANGGGKGGKVMAGKGKGKGYQGYCFDCGRQGHKRGEPACWMASGAIAMDVGAVGMDYDKELQAVEFGGGAVWEISAVEYCENPAEDEGEWKVAKRKAKGRCRKQDLKRKDDEVHVQIEKRAKEIQKEIEEMLDDEYKLKVVDMEKNAVQIEVDEKFIGAVYCEGSLMSMNFQVAKVKKASAAVSKICQAGNVVQFGEEECECFILNKKTKKKVMMRQRRGSYIINVEFVKKVADDTYETIGKDVFTVDSGAEESVCPLSWGEAFGLRTVSPGQEMKMINAAGDTMQHYGSRKVQFAAAAF